MFLISLESILSIVVISLLAIVLTLAILILVLFKLSAKVIDKNGKTRKFHYDELNLNANDNEIVFLGDSLTEFYDTDEFFHSANAYNRGIAGDTTDGVLDRLSTNVICMKPRKIILQIGTNDLGLKKKPDYVYTNIVTIIEKIRYNLPSTQLVVLSLYPVNDHAFTYSKPLVKPRKNADILEINQRLESFCAEQSITYVDVHSQLIDENGELKKEYTVEGLHINFAGYQVITKILEPYVYE